MKGKGKPRSAEVIAQEIRHILERNENEGYLRRLLAYAMALEREMNK